MTSKNVLLKSVCKVFVDDSGSDFHAVSDVDLDIKSGEFITLLGPSGCGKTTTLRMIAGFESISSGDIFFGADNVRDVAPNKRDCTMVFQSYALFPHLNVFDNVAYGLRIKKIPDAEIQKKVNDTFSIMNLQDYSDRMPNQLSGGQQQRVALARALVMEPSVLLFDEPLSNLDAKLRLTMRDEIRRIQKEVGITAIYVTHDQNEAMSMSDRIVVMNKGRIEQVGTPHEIYQCPASRFVADFIGVANFIDGDVISIDQESAVVRVADQQLPLPSSSLLEKGQKITIVTRPESISITNMSAIDSVFSLHGTVQRSAFMGAVQDYWVEVAGQTLQVTVSNPKAHTVFAPGETIKLQMPTEALHWVHH